MCIQVDSDLLVNRVVRQTRVWDENVKAEETLTVKIIAVLRIELSVAQAKHDATPTRPITLLKAKLFHLLSNAFRWGLPREVKNADGSQGRPRGEQ